MMSKYLKLYAFMLFVLSLGGCVTITHKLDKAQLNDIQNGEIGGMIVELAYVSAKGCQSGDVQFSDMDSAVKTSAGFVFGAFGMKDVTNVLSIPEGRYYPIAANCSYTSNSGGFTRTERYSYKVDRRTQKPIVVRNGEITNPGSINFFRTRTNDNYSDLLFTYVDDVTELSETIQKKYPNLIIRPNE